MYSELQTASDIQQIDAYSFYGNFTTKQFVSVHVMIPREKIQCSSQYVVSVTQSIVIDPTSMFWFIVRMMIDKGIDPLVSIIIPSRDNVAKLKPCIDSIENKSTYKNYEIIIVDNNSQNDVTKSYLASLKHKLFSYDKPFNFSRIANFAVTKANGEHVIFLNDDTKVISPDWIERMLEHSEKPQVGVVGVKLLHADDTVQHAGMLIGVGTMTAHAFEGFPRDHVGHNGLLQAVHECSSVTGACMMIKRRLFEEIGGFDEHYAYAYTDADLCLRLREKGYSIIYTPYAELYHYEHTTRPYTIHVEETRYFIKHWKDLLLEGDPYYDRNLSRVKPYTPKTKEERFVLTDLGLFEEADLKMFRSTKRYFKIAITIIKRHGVRRLGAEFIRYLITKGGRKDLDLS